MTLSALADPRVLAEEGDRSRCESTDRRQSFSTMFRPGATPELQTLTAWWATNMPAVSQPGSHITAAEMIGYPVDKSTKQIWSESIGGNTDEKLRKLSQKSYTGWFLLLFKGVVTSSVCGLLFCQIVPPNMDYLWEIERKRMWTNGNPLCYIISKSIKLLSYQFTDLIIVAFLHFSS